MEHKAVIELEAGRGYLRWVCEVCGETQEKDNMLSRVVFEDNDGTILEYEICRTCLEAGPDGAVRRSAQRAEQLEQMAALHRDAIPNALRIVSVWKTGKDYDAVRDEWEEQVRREDPLSPEEAAVSTSDEIPF